MMLSLSLSLSLDLSISLLLMLFPYENAIMSVHSPRALNRSTSGLADHSFCRDADREQMRQSGMGLDPPFRDSPSLVPLLWFPSFRIHRLVILWISPKVVKRAMQQRAQV